MEKHTLGGASVHIKAIGSTQIPHQSKPGSEGRDVDQYPLRTYTEELIITQYSTHT